MKPLAKLGSEKRPVIARVQTQDRAMKIMQICEEHGWKVIAGIEPDKPEDISDVQKLLSQAAYGAAPVAVRPTPKTGLNAPCPCGSGRKFKRCCAKSPTA